MLLTVFILGAVTLSVVMQNGVMFNAVRLSVVALESGFTFSS